MPIQQFGSHNLYQWTREHLNNVLTSGNNKIIQDPLIANAFKSIDRKDFIPVEYQNMAYEDKPVSIGYDQTISQPTVVAQMLSLLRPREGKKYLDIGSGSGYVSALLGLIAGDAGHVFALERNQYLADFARQNIQKYSILAARIDVLFKDGVNGYVEKAPYDFIHCAAAFDTIPVELKNQLVVGGRMVAPTQNNDIRLIERISPTEFDERVYQGFIFVPMREGIE